jgi:hypothetical protein
VNSGQADVREVRRPTAEDESSATDIRPDAHVENLVEAERGATLDKDLLDSRRPVE